MKIAKNLLPNFTRKKSFGFGVLDSHVESQRGGFSKAAFDEKRQSTRVEISVPVWYQVKKTWSKWLLGKTIDHSGTGIRLALPPGVVPGTEIRLRMKLPNTPQPIDAKGVVVWVEPEIVGNVKRATVECGVAFRNLRSGEQQEKLIFLIADKISNIGMQLTKDVVVAPVQSVEELRQCYRMVYDGYLARRYCKPKESKMHYHYYSLLPDSRTFCLKEKEKVIGTVTVLLDSPCGLPMESLFAREIEHLRNKGRKLAEVSLLSMAMQDNNKKMFSLTNIDKQVRLFRLFKIALNYMRYAAGVTDVIIGVHPKHETLYKYICFKAIGPPKSYSGARNNPALPLHLDFPVAEDSASFNAVFMSNPIAVEYMNNGLKFNADIVQQFLCEDPQVWASIPEKGQKYLKRCYPHIKPPRKNHFFSFIKF